MAEKTTKTPKAENYSAEATTRVVSAYTAAPTAETVALLATELGKSIRSVIAKLSKEGVYVKKTYKTKTGETVVKKDETADAIGRVLSMTEAEVTSLTKANKTALSKIFTALANSKPIE